MTAYSRQSQHEKWGTLVWELRGVNHRFLEISLRLPENLRHLELEVRKRLQKSMSRGKLELTLKLTPGGEMPFNMVINEPLLYQLANAVQRVAKHIPGSQVNLIDILSWQGILDTQQTHLEQLEHAALELLDRSIEDMTQARYREGEGIQQFITERLQELQRHLMIIQQRLPVLKQQARDKIITRFNELSVTLDSERLEQEMVWLLQKMDVAEEIQRIHSHCAEVTRILQQGQSVGRRLDFFMQELNREANTLGSKCNDTEVTQAVVELKVQIEQMREQVQNIE